ncbi:hypothetical protein CLOM_g1968 [Closterium sp. NIES-68]|nr:hypothetical protein CLOM_g1968 [Closterium sp. NIES-68]GJP59644.1 hypothetical protein CLOP_g13919 [Closterium sp. NIES-67]
MSHEVQTASLSPVRDAITMGASRRVHSAAAAGRALRQGVAARRPQSAIASLRLQIPAKLSLVPRHNDCGKVAPLTASLHDSPSPVSVHRGLSVHDENCSESLPDSPWRPIMPVVVRSPHADVVRRMATPSPEMDSQWEVIDSMAQPTDHQNKAAKRPSTANGSRSLELTVPRSRLHRRSESFSYFRLTALSGRAQQRDKRGLSKTGASTPSPRDGESKFVVEDASIGGGVDGRGVHSSTIVSPVGCHGNAATPASASGRFHGRGFSLVLSSCSLLSPLAMSNSNAVVGSQQLSPSSLSREPSMGLEDSGESSPQLYRSSSLDLASMWRSLRNAEGKKPTAGVQAGTRPRSMAGCGLKVFSGEIEAKVVRETVEVWREEEDASLPMRWLQRTGSQSQLQLMQGIDEGEEEQAQALPKPAMLNGSDLIHTPDCSGWFRASCQPIDCDRFEGQGRSLRRTVSEVVKVEREQAHGPVRVHAQKERFQEPARQSQKEEWQDHGRKSQEQKQELLGTLCSSKSSGYPKH